MIEPTVLLDPTRSVEALHGCDGYLDAARPKPDEDTKDVSHCVKGEYR